MRAGDHEARHDDAVERHVASPAEPVAVGRRSTALLLSVAVMGAGGLAFNAMAAHLVSTDELGIQASLFFWVTLVNQLTSMGLPVAVARLSRYVGTGTERPLLLWSFVYTTASSVAGTAAFFLLEGQHLRPEVHHSLRVWGGAAAFLIVAGVITGFSVTLLLEIRLVAIGKGRWVVIRAVVVNVLRCGLLLVPSLRREPMMLLVLNAGINAVSGLVGGVILTRWSGRERHEPMVPLPAPLRPELRFATVNWLGTLALLAAQFGFPVIADITPAQNAAFYLAWQIMAVVFVIPVTIGHVVVVEASSHASKASLGPMMKGLSLAVALTALCAAVSFVVSRPATRLLFGAKYHVAGSVLPIMLTAAIPWCVVALSLARARADGDGRLTVGITVVYGAVTLALAGLFTHNDPMESAAAWLVANTVSAVAVAVASSWRHRARLLHSAG